MLFRRQFHSGILDGSVTLTFRAWKKPRARVGGRHRFGGRGVLEVQAVETVQVGSIGQAEARRAGFADVAELVAELARSAAGSLTAASEVYRVEFRFVEEPDPRVAMQREVGAAALEEVVERLASIDRRSRRGPWTAELLGLIARHPGVVSSQLATRTGRDRRAFKADVRKLKALGLTRSHEVGYSLSPRGRAVLVRLGDPADGRAGAGDPRGRNAKSRESESGGPKSGSPRSGSSESGESRAREPEER